MAVHQHSTPAPRFLHLGRPTAPARIMGGSDFAALLDGRANVERRIDLLVGGLDDFDLDLLDDADMFGGDDA